MKRMKKLTAFIAALSVAIMMVPTVAFAADAELRFSDPSTTVGATFDVTARMSMDDNNNLTSANATLTYDTSYLRFVSGDNAVDNGGQIQITGTGGGTTTELSWTLQFQALQEGTTTVSISSATGEASDGSSLNVTQGSSTVTIGQGDPSLITDAAATDGAAATGTGGQVTVDGTAYTINNDFSDALIPEGFTRTQMTYEGTNCTAALQESSGKYAVYLLAATGESDFFLYDPDNGTFTPFEQVDIAPDRFIVFLNEDTSKQVPATFQLTSITVEGKEFPAWQNVDATDYYIVYALNADGKKGFYQYDTVDGTYQRYTVDTGSDEADESSSSPIGRVLDLIRNHLDIVLIAAWAVFLLMLLILIILAVKLSHRNAELDDLYDEYGIDEEEEHNKKNKKEDKKINNKKKKEPKVKEKSKKDKNRVADEDDFYDLEDEDDYESEEVYQEDYEDEYGYDELEDDEPSDRRGHGDEDDTFKMDIIDLD